MQNNPFPLPLKDLPESPHLGIRCLSAVFRYKTNSYKYYWFLAILEMVKNGLNRLPINQLAAEMLAQAWYPVHYFRLNFGPQDQLGHLVLRLKLLNNLPIQAKREHIRNTVLKPLFQDSDFEESFHDLLRYVPQRFLTPWFATELRGLPDHQRDRKIQTMAKKSFSQPNPPLYHFAADSLGIILQMHPVWMDYLETNFRIVRDFVLWNLIEYLRQRNPHVPNLPEKLFPPEKREMKQARKYWEFVLQQKTLLCPYSDQSIPQTGFSLDHFIPWSFTCHNQLWNLVPAAREVNSAKSDCLPELERYLMPFTSLQFEALHCFLEKATPGQHTWIEDYHNLFGHDSMRLQHLSQEAFLARLRDTIVPLEQIAANMGFTRNWRFPGTGARQEAP